MTGEGVVAVAAVELLRALSGSDLRGGGGEVKSRGLDLVNLRGKVAVHEMGHEVEVEDLPHGDVADGGDEGDGVVKKYNGHGEEVVSPARKHKDRGVMPLPFRGARLDSRYQRKRGSGKRKDEVLCKWSATRKQS